MNRGEGVIKSTININTPLPLACMYSWPGKGGSSNVKSLGAEG